MKVAAVDAAVLGAEHAPEGRARYWVSSCLGLGSVVDLSLGLGIAQRVREAGLWREGLGPSQCRGEG